MNTSQQRRQVILYMRPGCHLCQEVEELLATLGGEVPLLVTQVNILDDFALYQQYRWSIPVVAITGGATLSAPIHEQDLRAALQLPASEAY